MIAEGEVMQLANVGNCEMTESDYRQVIRCKTALLFEAASHTGALVAAKQSQASGNDQPSEHAISALRHFGLHFGMAYQLIDDWLDYAGDPAVMGKNVGDDLAEGKLTLPIQDSIPPRQMIGPSSARPSARAPAPASTKSRSHLRRLGLYPSSRGGG